MANQTFATIVALIEDYLRDSTAYSTQIGYFVNFQIQKLAGEHNFTYLTTSSDITQTAATYYATWPTDARNILKIRWYLASTGQTGIIRYKSPRQFIKDHGYIDWASRGSGTPQWYTVMGDGSGARRIYFNCDADQEYKIRVWYAEQPATLASTNSHEFFPDWLGVMAIVSGVLWEIKEMVSLDTRGRALAEKHQYYRDLLIAADMNMADEEVTVEAYFEDPDDGDDATVNPYEWI